MKAFYNIAEQKTKTVGRVDFLSSEMEEASIEEIKICVFAGKNCRNYITNIIPATKG